MPLVVKLPAGITDNVSKIIDPDKVVFIDDAFSQEFMAEVLNCCDIYAAPSRIEGFGMIQVEAQACGKPVISINVGGPKDVIIHEKTGFLVDVEHEVKLDREWAYTWMGFEENHQIKFPEPKTFAYRANIEELADCTLKLLTDNILREQMGNAAAKHALENFNYKVTAKRMLDLIKKYVVKS